MCIVLKPETSARVFAFCSVTPLCVACLHSSFEFFLFLTFRYLGSENYHEVGIFDILTNHISATFEFSSIFSHYFNIKCKITVYVFCTFFLKKKLNRIHKYLFKTCVYFAGQMVYIFGVSMVKFSYNLDHFCVV